MTALRFCFPTTFYPPYSFGGDAVGVQRLAQALVRRGHSVTVVHDVDAFVALNGGREPNGTGTDDGVEVIQLRSGLGILSPLLTQQTGRPTLHRKRLREILDRGRFDVVNFHNASLAGGPGLFGYGGSAVRIHMAHDHWLVCPTHVLWRHKREPCPARQCLRCQLRYARPPQLWRSTGYLEQQLRHVDVFIAMSEFSREKHRDFGFPRDMEVLPYFLPERMAPHGQVEGSPNSRPYFLFVGRLEKIKGLDQVIPLFSRYHDADLLIAGRGEHEHHLRELARGIDRVKFLGAVPLDRLAAYYRHAIATIVPSVCFETFGIVIIESFREGTPVIARRLGPFPEIVSACGGGELFQSDAELLAAMTRVQQDTALRARLASNAREGFLRHWSESAVVPRYLEIVDRVRSMGHPAKLPAESR